MSSYSIPFERYMKIKNKYENFLKNPNKKTFANFHESILKQILIMFGYASKEYEIYQDIRKKYDKLNGYHGAIARINLEKKGDTLDDIYVTGNFDEKQIEEIENFIDELEEKIEFILKIFDKENIIFEIMRLNPGEYKFMDKNIVFYADVNYNRVLRFEKLSDNKIATRIYTFARYIYELNFYEYIIDIKNLDNQWREYINSLPTIIKENFIGIENLI